MNGVQGIRWPYNTTCMTKAPKGLFFMHKFLINVYDKKEFYKCEITANSPTNSQNNSFCFKCEQQITILYFHKKNISDNSLFCCRTHSNVT